MQLDTEFSLKTAFRPYFVSYQKLVKNRKLIGCCRVHSSCVFTLGRFSFEFCSFFITVVTCPVPSPSSGTRATCPRNATVHHNAVYYNKTCQFSCEDGYAGSGSQVRRCQRNGTWSGQNYSCQSRSSKLGKDRYVIYIPFYFVNNHRQVSIFGVWWEWIWVAAVYKCTSGQRSFYCKGEAAWNSLPGELRNYATFKSKNKLQALLFDEF